MRISMLGPVISGALCAVPVLLLGCGPGQQSGPSYAELVTIYNGEHETLERLERQRKELDSDYKAKLQALGGSGDRLGALGDVLKAAEQLQSETELDPTVIDPNEALDRAVEQAARAQDLAGGLLDALANSQPAETEEDEQTKQKRAQLNAEWQKRLEKIDKEIEQQKQRVERARKARDAAQPGVE